MKKKILCFLLLLFTMYVFYAEAYFASDGYSEAYYEGTTAKVRAYDLYRKREFFDTVKPFEVEKLTKRENEFLWNALNKWDYQYGEVYTVQIFTGLAMGIQKAIVLYVEIERDTIYWYGLWHWLIE